MSKPIFNWFYHSDFEPLNGIVWSRDEPCQNYKIVQCFNHFNLGQGTVRSDADKGRRIGKGTSFTILTGSQDTGSTVHTAQSTVVLSKHG